MTLLQTLSCLHVVATLALPQMLDSIVVVVARQTVPQKQAFSGFGLWDVGDGHGPFASVQFWVVLVCQIVLVVGHCWYCRKSIWGSM